MSDNNEDPGECDAVAGEFAELALGIHSGRQRSEVLNHVKFCGRCSAQLEQLAFAPDTMLLLAPESEPPLAFEQRLAERLQASGAEQRRRRLRRVDAVSTIAVLLLVLGFGLGDIATARKSNDQGRFTSADLTLTRLTSRGQVLGEAFVSRARPEWVFMSINAGAWSGAVTCEMTLTGGTVKTIGKFKLSAGYVAWGASLKSPAAQVRAAQLIAAKGTVIASANFPT